MNIFLLVVSDGIASFQHSGKGHFTSLKASGYHLLPARTWHWMNASFVRLLFPPRFEYQLRPSAESPPPFCNAQRQPSLSCILLHGELSSCATFGPAGFGCGA